jgi:hypothetical protein
MDSMDRDFESKKNEPGFKLRKLAKLNWDIKNLRSGN